MIPYVIETTETTRSEPPLSPCAKFAEREELVAAALDALEEFRFVARQMADERDRELADVFPELSLDNATPVNEKGLKRLEIA